MHTWAVFRGNFIKRRLESCVNSAYILFSVHFSVRFARNSSTWQSGSGSIRQRFGSGSGSFYQQAKIVRKTLIPTVLWLILVILSLKNDVNVPSKSSKQKNFQQKICFLLTFCMSMTKIAGSGSISHSHGSADPDPDPHQNIMDPEHCWHLCAYNFTFWGNRCPMFTVLLMKSMKSTLYKMCIREQSSEEVLSKEGSKVV